MENFNWDKEDILNSDLSPCSKEILLGEINGTPSSNDPNFQKAKTIIQTKERAKYHKYLKALYREIPDLTLFIQHAYHDFNIASCTYEDIPTIDITPEKLIKNTQSFYEFLGDDELLAQYNYFINQKGVLRIQPYNPSNPICGSVNGRCLFDASTGNAFLSCYIRGNLKDYSTFAHETAHLIIETLFFEQINPLIEKHFTEFVAYYIQILSYCFYSIHFNIPEIFPVLLHNQMVNIINDMWFLFIQSLIMQRRFTKANIRYLNERLKKENISMLLGDEDIDRFYINPTKIIESISAFLMALDLFVNSTPTFQKGVINFKEMLTSQTTNVFELFKNNNINFMEDDLTNFKTFYEKSLHLHLK